jgi:glycerol-3-phosphate dehydrogenase
VSQPDSLEAGVLDVLVIGGGIVGAGVARDAAMRGMRVGLVEQHDFASGTSSRSSRLLHGGIRYLAQGRIGLVREANKEKTVIREIAPHLAEPLAFIFPTRKGTPWSWWKLSIGVKLYDLLCGWRRLGRSSSLNAQQTLALLPGLSTDRLTGSVRYFDGLTNDARLVLDTLRSAARYGASVRNYVRFDSARRDGDVWIAAIEGGRSGNVSEVQARAIVNAAGPWSDRLPNSSTKLRLTKGVHLVVDRERFAVLDAVVIAEGSRILFAIPWGERVILGTTDTDYDGPLDNPPCNAEDVDYVLRAVNDAFPTARLARADVLSTWAGLRPMVADPHGNPSDISRRHEIKMCHAGWWDVTGGKLTTYRLMAEETVTQIARHLGMHGAKRCQTAHVPLLENRLADDPSGILPPPVTQENVRHFCHIEWASHLDDVMIRRTSWHYYHRDRREIADRVATWMAAEMRWDTSQREMELNRYQKHLPEVTDEAENLHA